MSKAPDPMSIAELARQAGVTVRTVRYYVAEGLLPPPAGAGPRSAYFGEHLLRLEAVRCLKARYYPLAEIRRTLADRSAEEIGALLADLSIDARSGGDAGESPSTASGGFQRPVGQLGLDARRAPGPLGRAEVLPEAPVDLPTEATWRRVCLAPDVELHFRPSADLARSAAIRRLVAVAQGILSGRLEAWGGSGAHRT